MSSTWTILVILVLCEFVNVYIVNTNTIFTVEVKLRLPVGSDSCLKALMFDRAIINCGSTSTPPADLQTPDLEITQDRSSRRPSRISKTQSCSLV